MPDAGGNIGELGDLHVFFERKHKRWVVRSRDLAVRTAHDHFNILGAVRVAEAEMAAAGQRSPVIWGQYLARNRRWNPACQIPLEVLRLIRLHNVPGCRHVRAVLAEYVRLLEAAEGARPDGSDGKRELRAYWRTAPSEPAPDTEIRPPDPEPAGLFDAVEPPADPAASWEINAAVALLTKRAGLPRYIADDIDGWNTARCAALWAASKSWDEVGAIYATAPPGGPDGGRDPDPADRRGGSSVAPHGARRHQPLSDRTGRTRLDDGARGAPRTREPEAVSDEQQDETGGTP